MRRWLGVGGVTVLVSVLGVASSTAVAPGGHRPIIRIRQGTSTNWAGYAAYGQAGKFTSVTGTWTVPTVTCSSAQNTYSSFWSGLDGDNSSTVEQTGTDSDCVNGVARYYAWYEMYPHPSFLVPLTVAPGDVITTSVSVAGRGLFVLRMTDGGRSFSTTQKLNQASRSSAEVIAEAPSSGGVLPLANFGTVSFSGTTANGAPLSAFAPQLDPITMVNASGGVKAAPSAYNTSTQGFTVQWKSS
jgi:hypothetical protein